MSEWGRDQIDAAVLEAERKRQKTINAKEDSLLRILAESVASVIERDPHHWKPRPCQTCRAISTLLGRPFGCENDSIRRLGRW
jgi:hypothetical protein